MATTLLLQCNSSPILDECGHSITSVGDAAVSSAQSKFGGYSLLLDGTGDYLNCGDSADFELGSGDFTMEAWVRLTGYSNAFSGFYAGVIIGKDASAARAFHWKIVGTASSYTSMVLSTNGTELSASFTFNLNQWYHVAVCKSGTSLRFFVDGTQIGTTQTHNTAIPDVSTALTVGGMLYTGFEYNFKGYMDDIRITKGEALYAADFVPPTQPFFYNNVVLQLPMDGANGSATFTDYTGKAVTVTGTPQISTTQSKFGGSSAYFPSGINYLTTSADANAVIGTGDFTIEFWAYLSTTAGQQNFIASTGTTSLTIYCVSSSLRLYNGADRISSAFTTTGTWVHIAVCRAFGTTKMFVNGMQAGSAYTDTSNYDGQQYMISTSNSTFAINNGYIDAVRVCRAAKYTTNFTPHTAAHPYEFTKLLIHADGNNGQSCIRSENGQAVTAVGNVQLSTAQSKIGGTSLAFDGTGDYASIAYSNGLHIQNGENLTIEFWMYPTAIKTAGCVLLCGSTVNAGYAQMKISTVADGKMALLVAGSDATAWHTVDAAQYSGTSTYATNTWQHIAVVKNGTTYTMYVNGVSKISYSGPTTPFQSGGSTLIGSSAFSSEDFAGYIDEIRISKGIALYTSNFTPTTSAYSLTGQFNGTISGIVRDDTGTPAARTVRLYNRLTGSLIQETTSNGTTGAYSFSRPDTNEYYLLFLDNDAGTQYNALVFDRVVPV